MFRLIFNTGRHLLPISCNSKMWTCPLQCGHYCSMYVSKMDQSKCLKITDGQKSNNYYYFWLRDHCRCKKCYNNITAQRKLNIDEIPSDIKVVTADIKDGVLEVIWEGGHESRYLISWLESCLFENYQKLLRRRYKLWDKSEVVKRAPVASVDHDELLKSDTRLTDLIRSLVDYGVGFVKNAPVSVEGTESAVRRIGSIKTTFFGSMWEFSDDLNHSDTAYTKEGLEGHTDNTYFTESAGLQVLHCLHHSGEGGETILVDGFKAASILKENYPDVFNRLATTAVGAEYIEEGQHHINISPILKLNPITGEIEQIRFNLKDRAPLILLHDQIPRYYEDLKILTKIVREPALEWKFKLTPGIIMIIDNFRLLHGRTAYTGSRRMCGCYMERTDFLSKARVLKVLRS